MKKLQRFLMLIMCLALLAGLAACGSDEEDEDEAEDSVYMTDNVMMGRNFSQEIPAWIYGRVIDSGSNDTEDGYALDKSAAPDAVERYIEDCREAGYELTGTERIEDNSFYTLGNGEYVIYIMDTPALEKVFVTVERAQTQCAGDLTAQRVSTDTRMTLTQIGQDVETYGMGYVIRLTDGRFLVFDGGYRDNSAADRIYDEMAGLTPGGEEIVIAAWVLSHSHNDHCGAFVDFTNKYHIKAKIEKVFYNFGYEEQYTSTDQNYAFYDLVKSMANEKLWPGVQRVNPHPGQTYDFGGARLTFLYTGELMTGVPMASSNSMSNVWVMEAAGQRLMFTADANSECSPYILQMYSEKTLNCDVVQLAHHGYNVGAPAPEFYAAMTPDWVLWPTSRENYERPGVQSGAANRWIFENVDQSRIIVSYDEVQRFELPLESAD